MPVLNLKVAGPLDQAQAQSLTSLLTDLTASILRKKRELTAVIIEPVRADLWSIGGSAIPLLKLATFALEIKVTQDTNTSDEKAAYIQAVFSGMQDLLGSLHDASYVAIDEIPAAAWGYGGRTQRDRFAVHAAA